MSILSVDRAISEKIERVADAASREEPAFGALQDGTDLVMGTPFITSALTFIVNTFVQDAVGGGVDGHVPSADTPASATPSLDELIRLHEQ